MYTLTKGKTSVTLYSSWAPPMMQTRLAPGQKAKGTIYFQKAAATIKGNPL